MRFPIHTQHKLMRRVFFRWMSFDGRWRATDWDFLLWGSGCDVSVRPTKRKRWVSRAPCVDLVIICIIIPDQELIPTPGRPTTTFIELFEPPARIRMAWVGDSANFLWATQWPLSGHSVTTQWPLSDHTVATGKNGSSCTTSKKYILYKYLTF